MPSLSNRGMTGVAPVACQPAAPAGLTGRLRAVLLGIYLQILFLHHGCPLRLGAYPVDLSAVVDDPLGVCLAVAGWLH